MPFPEAASAVRFRNLELPYDCLEYLLLVLGARKGPTRETGRSVMEMVENRGGITAFIHVGDAKANHVGAVSRDIAGKIVPGPISVLAASCASGSVLSSALP